MNSLEIVALQSGVVDLLSSSYTKLFLRIGSAALKD
jgi:hypothetical protein